VSQKITSRLVEVLVGLLAEAKAKVLVGGFTRLRQGYGG